MLPSLNTANTSRRSAVGDTATGPERKSAAGATALPHAGKLAASVDSELATFNTTESTPVAGTGPTPVTCSDRVPPGANVEQLPAPDPQSPTSVPGWVSMIRVDATGVYWPESPVWVGTVAEVSRLAWS